MGQYSGVLYIPPQARASLQVADEEDHVLFSLMEKVLLFLDSDREVFLILGDSGAGKSTFNRHLECALWKAYRKGGPIPLYINLPSIDKPEHDMIIKQLQIHNFTADQIRELKEHRHLILICDGYDESHLTTNLHSKNLLNKPGQWRAKIIISCRTQHLGPDYRGRFQPNVDRYITRPKELFQEAVIASFSSTQIQEYVEQYVINEKPAWTPVIYMDKLRRIPHLMDLVSNPFLLSLALEALPNLVGSQDDLESITITRVKLYDNFVDKWLSVGKDRLETSSLGPGGREAFEKLLDSCFEQQAINFAKRLATAIFSKQDGRPVVQYPDPVDGQEWKAEFFGPGSEATHLRMSIPLVRNGKQHRFNHRSLLEYFYSRVFFEPPRPDSDNLDSSEESCVSYQSAVILDHSLNQLSIINEYAVLAFLVERVNAYQAFRDQLNAMVELSKEVPSVSLAAANAMTILVKAGIRFNGKDLQGIRIPGANLSEGEFDLAVFQGADLCNVNLTRAWLRQADFKKAHMAGVQFGESPYLAERSGVWSCAYSPDGKKFATGCSSGDISIYSTRTWKKVYALQKSTESPTTCIRPW
ncbi:hypothetical protein BGZ97_011861 [Linnemannia gamsii]|uniref:NACHT domain-containing protein n=1 Tax=Linnemannia gamsii TaxID=64522 RepID=A0A9P6UMB2_9FUNG|nr:hypothetical protein BGZ97_011861 [Linnemannia gamsii]